VRQRAYTDAAAITGIANSPVPIKPSAKIVLDITRAYGKMCQQEAEERLRLGLQFLCL